MFILSISPAASSAGAVLAAPASVRVLPAAEDV
jgi:hypothetical protein